MRGENDDIWHYREWQWWKGHPWGDSCRPRYWTKAPFQFDQDKAWATIEWRMDGFDTFQQFLLPENVVGGRAVLGPGGHRPQCLGPRC